MPKIRGSNKQRRGTAVIIGRSFRMKKGVTGFGKKHPHLKRGTVADPVKHAKVVRGRRRAEISRSDLTLDLLANAMTAVTGIVTASNPALTSLIIPSSVPARSAALETASEPTPQLKQGSQGRRPVIAEMK